MNLSRRLQKLEEEQGADREYDLVIQWGADGEITTMRAPARKGQGAGPVRLVVRWEDDQNDAI